MRQYTKRKEIRISKEQDETLIKLHLKYSINPAQFIRDAIKEKIKRDWPNLKNIRQKRIKNAPDWVYD